MIRNDSSVTDNIVKNATMPYPVLDFHAHMGNLVNAYMPCEDPKDMLALMDRANVRCAIFASHFGLYMGNRAILDDIAICKEAPSRFFIYMPVYSPEPNFENDRNVFEQYREHMAGFKFHPSITNVPLDDEKNRRYWEYADENELLVLVHTWRGLETQTENILKKYRRLHMVGGHCFYDHWDFAAKMATTYENFYPELTAVMTKRGALERMIEQCGSKKILFGTDMPWFCYYYYMGAVLSADITDEDRLNILYKNGRELLKKANLSIDWGQDEQKD